MYGLLNAWVTSASGEDQVDKAILLARSLKRVKTCGRLVVIVGHGFAKNSKKKLKATFDLVIVTAAEDAEDGWKGGEEEDDDFERIAILESFSLVVFNKVVYLSPNMMVVTNCDELFSMEPPSPSSSTVLYYGRRNGSFDPSILMMSPSRDLYESLEEAVLVGLMKLQTRKGEWRQELGKLLENNVANLAKLEEEEDKYNLPVSLFGDDDDGVKTHLFSTITTTLDAAIVNFVNGHPWDLWKEGRKDDLKDKIAKASGIVEKLALSSAVSIIMEQQMATNTTTVDNQLGVNSSWRNEYLQHHEPIAIVGMSFRLPGGNNETEFWKLLIEGGDAIRPVPPHRWTKEHSVLHHNNDAGVEAGFLDIPIDEFDAKFFGINPKDGVVLDPQIRLLHEVSWEALEQGGIDPSSLHGTLTGIFVGSWMYNYKDLVQNTASNLEQNMFRGYMGNSIAAGSARLSHFFGTTGPAISTESGCSSAIVAVHMGVKSLRNRECNMALACGVNLLIHPFTCGMMEGVLAPDYRCKTFDAKADGFARAEGVATLVMKRLSDAVRDGDSIWGLVRGSAVASEGFSKSLGTPTVACEALAMELALRDAGLNGGDVDYVETHGTGTTVGDPMEVAAITKAYASSSHHGRRQEPLVIGSVKTNVGHTESVSGITGIIKVLLSMKHETIPPHLHLESLNPEINLEALPATIPLEPVAWPKSQKRRRIAGVSSFGITGTDGHVIIEEPPQQQVQTNSKQNQMSNIFGIERPLHALKLSAKSPESFEALIQKYGVLLESTTEDKFEDICYSANTGRATFSTHRAVILAKDGPQAAKILKDGTFKKADVQGGGGGGALCFLFTGQGSQYPGMAKGLYDSSPIFKMHFDAATQRLQNKYSISIKEAMWGSADPTSSSSELLNRTLYSQTSIFVLEYCLLKLWESWGVSPDYVMGHSLGEFAAAVASGALTFEDALMLVAERSRLIDSLPRGKMLVIKANKKTVDQAIANFHKTKSRGFWVDFAALNSADQTVVAGDSGMIQEFAKYCEEEQKLKCIVLASSHAFHSRHMEPMLEEYGKIASAIRRPSSSSPGVILPKYVSGMEGKIMDVERLDANYWVAHTRQKVSFMEACKSAQSEGCTLFLEIGPHPVLSALTMMNMEGTAVTCLPSLRRKTEDWTVLLESLSKLYLSSWKGSIDWKGLDRCYPRSRVPLPFYPFSRKSIWVEVRPQLPLLHPLLGRILPAAASSLFIYEAGLSSKSVPWLQDHVIGNTVVFPGAGFLELCLSAGFASSQGYKSELPKPRRPIALKDIKIVAPLDLQDSRTTVLQTTVDLKDEDSNDSVDGGGGGSDSDTGGGYPVTVSRFCSDATGCRAQEWRTHATARFHPVLPLNSLPPILLDQEQLSVSSMLEKWEKVEEVREFYQKLPEVGLRFGPTFQSLECGWKSEEENEDGGGGGILFKVKVPQDHQSYLIHPVIADAMLQSVMVAATSSKKVNKDDSQIKKMKLQVPVLIGEFNWLNSSPSSERYIYCATSSSSKLIISAHLVDEQGAPLAFMSSIEFVETSAKLVESMILQQHQQSSSSTTGGGFWEEVYRPIPGPLQHRKPFAEPHLREAFTPEICEEIRQLQSIPEDERQFYRHCNSTARTYFLRALYSLGWTPVRGQGFSTEELVSSLEIQEPFKPYVLFFLRALAAHNMLEMEEEGSGGNDLLILFRFPLEPPSPLEIESWLKNAPNKKSSEIIGGRPELQLVTEIGLALKDILLGAVAPLPILFSEDPAKPNASKFYQAMGAWILPFAHVISTKVVSPILKNTDELYCAAGATSAGSKKPVIRVLEIGAGTGSVTRQVLKDLESEQLSYDYTFTDISAAFFPQAEKEFEGSNNGRNSNNKISFRKYNMEVDPLEQGLIPSYYDLIIAGEVLHIAKDVKRTLRRVRGLLRPGGILQLLETILPDERITFMFGLLEGYWQFEDRGFRRWHTTLSPPMWEEALSEAGLRNVVCTAGYMGAHGVICCHAGEEESDEVVVVEEEPRHGWILFGEEGTSLTTALEERLARLNRAVTVFGVPPRMEAMTESEFKGELAEVFNKAASSPAGRKLEGVLYLWGLSSSEEESSTCSSQQLISLPLVSLCQLVNSLGSEMAPSVFVVTRGVHSVNGSQVLNPAAATLLGIVKSMNNENPFLSLSGIDLSPELPVTSQADDIFFSMWGDRKSDIYLSREGARLHPRLARVKQHSNDYLSLPNGCDRFKLILPETKLISDLEFTFLDNYGLENGEIEVEVKAMALNFRDVMVVLKPVPEFDRFNAIGLDVAGVVTKVGPGVEEDKWKVGDRVIGMQLDESLALPSHIKMKATHAVPLPAHMTFAEGATLPAVFSTAYYCLVRVADMKAGETLLIHTASGGVGLCAIQFAKRLGVEVIATAGSNRKRTFLRNLGIKHVFNSRNTEYGQQILEVTGGAGVDIVLNSLTGPGFKEESLRALRTNGRFVEMSKMNVWSVEEVRGMRPDVSYTIADLTSLEESQYAELYDSLKKQMAEGGESIQPIPYERFDALNIRGALNYLQKAKHVGKIVCAMPELKQSKGKKYYERTPMFNADSTYLVTGGLGGIGFEVVKWILRSGGKHVVIASRSPPKPEMAEKIQALNKGGGHVVSYSVDIGSFDQCQQLFDHIQKEFPPLRGVMHAAGVLADAFIENQSWDNFRHTYNPKVEGTRNLHELTKSLLLEHFVLFSSGSAVLGSPGQSNHSASNAFEDAFAHFRRSIGLPATTINWANWGEVGVATDVDFPGLSPISTAQGICALESCLRVPVRTQSVVINIDSVSMLTKLFPRVKTYLEDRSLLGGEVHGAKKLINSDEFWAEVDAAEEREDKVAVITRYIITVVRNTLNAEADEVIDESAEFSAIGVDSLMMLEMKNSLQNVLGSRVTVTAAQLKDCTTPVLMANRLVELLEGAAEDQQDLPSLEELTELIKEDCCLLPEQFRVDPSLPHKPIQEVSTVLLTGVTGTLGPYLLRELSNRSSISKIYCLVRKFGKMSSEDRLKSSLEKTGLILGEEVNDLVSKVECLQGDLTEPSFGLSPQQYASLAESVDAVVHSGVRADHTAKYWKTPDSKKSSVRSVNVLGTLRVLEFAADRRLKHVFHASTLLAINTIDENGVAPQGWQPNTAFDSITYNSGYRISKFIAEQLVKAAVERGLPAVVLRIPAITGDSGTGAVADFKSSHLHLRLLSMLRLRCMPEVPIPLPHIPVDACAALCTLLFFTERASRDVYNLHPKIVEVEQVLVGLAKEEFGIELGLVPYQEFLQRIRAEEEGSPLRALKTLYDESEGAGEQVDEHLDFCQLYVSNEDGSYAIDKIERLIPNVDEFLEPLTACLRRDLKYLKEHGVFQKFGISC